MEEDNPLLEANLVYHLPKRLGWFVFLVKYYSEFVPDETSSGFKGEHTLPTPIGTVY